MGLVTLSERSSLDTDCLTATLSSSKSSSNQGGKGREGKVEVRKRGEDTANFSSNMALMLRMLSGFVGGQRSHKNATFKLKEHV